MEAPPIYLSKSAQLHPGLHHTAKSFPISSTKPSLRQRSQTPGVNSQDPIHFAKAQKSSLKSAPPSPVISPPRSRSAHFSPPSTSLRACDSPSNFPQSLYPTSTISK